MNNLYVDMDGVLADFDLGFKKLSGQTPNDYRKKYGEPAMWKLIDANPGFYANLPLMPDAKRLVSRIKHLRLVALTGIPRNNESRNKKEKKEWLNRHFPSMPIICTKSSTKCDHCLPGDILIDDRTKYKKLWVKAGGIWITHVNAKSTISRLVKLGVI